MSQDTVHVSLRLPRWQRELLERALRDQERDLSSQIRHYLTRGLRSDGYLPAVHPCRGEPGER